MPKLNTKRELELKLALSKERARRLLKDAKREEERQAKLRAKMKTAPV